MEYIHVNSTIQDNILKTILNYFHEIRPKLLSRF